MVFFTSKHPVTTKLVIQCLATKMSLTISPCQRTHHKWFTFLDMEQTQRRPKRESEKSLPSSALHHGLPCGSEPPHLAAGKASGNSCAGNCHAGDSARLVSRVFLIGMPICPCPNEGGPRLELAHKSRCYPRPETPKGEIHTTQTEKRGSPPSR